MPVINSANNSTLGKIETAIAASIAQMSLGRKKQNLFRFPKYYQTSKDKSIDSFDIVKGPRGGLKWTGSKDSPGDNSISLDLEFVTNVHENRVVTVSYNGCDIFQLTCTPYMRVSGSRYVWNTTRPSEEQLLSLVDAISATILTGSSPLLN